MRHHVRLFLAIATLALAASGAKGCKSSSAPTTTSVPPAPTHAPATPTLPPSSTPSPSPTKAPTPTPTATPTPAPTATPAPPAGEADAGEAWSRPVDGMVMLYVPAGEYEMGSSEAQIDAALEACERDRGSGGCQRAWFEDESPPHPVTLDAYWIDQTEVTNAQYAAFLNEHGNQVEGSVA